MQKKLLIITVSTDDGRFLQNFFESLEQSSFTDFRLLVVLNACKDDSEKVCERSLLKPELMHLDYRRGFAAANNVGLMRAVTAGYEYILLLNPDTIVHEKAIETLVGFLDQNSSFAIAGSKQIVYSDETWREPNQWFRETSAEAAALGQLPEPRGIYKVLEHYYVQGAALMLRASVIKQIGLLDPLYVTFYEETDFCRRVIVLGKKIGIVLDSLVRHFEGGNWKRSNADRRRRDFLFLRNQFFFFLSAEEKKWHWPAVSFKLAREQWSIVAKKEKDVTLNRIIYPLVLLAVLLRLRSIFRLSRRLQKIRAGQTLPDHYWAIQ
jgi:GT2 family glycosyltransferase